MRDQNSVGVGHNHRATGHGDSTDVDRLAYLASLAFSGAPHAYPTRENRESYPLERIDVSHAPIDDGANQTPRLRCIRQHLAEVSGAVAAGVDDQHIARLALLERAMDGAVVANYALYGEGRAADSGAFPNRPDRRIHGA